MVTALPAHSSLRRYAKNASMSVDSILLYLRGTPARRVIVLCRKGAYVPCSGMPKRRCVLGPSARACSSWADMVAAGGSGAEVSNGFRCWFVGDSVGASVPESSRSVCEQQTCTRRSNAGPRYSASAVPPSVQAQDAAQSRVGGLTRREQWRVKEDSRVCVAPRACVSEIRDLEASSADGSGAGAQTYVLRGAAAFCKRGCSAGTSRE